jgi:gamma-glutamyltranspeptidase/glutathione hydrolase
LKYDVESWGDVASVAGAVCAIKKDRGTGLLHAGADLRREAYAAAW